MIYGALILIATLISSCASPKYHDREAKAPAYQEGSGVAISDQNTISGRNPPTKESAYSNSATNAVSGLLEAGIALAASPNYYKPSTIRGTCVIGEAALTQVPCRHLTIELRDAANVAVGETSTDESGQFAFYVKKAKIYRLQLATVSYQLTPEDAAKTYTMGATVVLHALRSSATAK